jgi:hypothetical protein
MYLVKYYAESSIGWLASMYIPRDKGCQMAYFKTKNPNLGSFWEGLAMKNVGIGILCPFGLFFCNLVYFGHLVYFMVIWYISPLLVCCTKKNLATLLVTQV